MSEDQKPNPDTNYEQLAAQLLQGWQQQLTETVAQTMMQGQQAWQSWLQQMSGAPEDVQHDPAATAAAAQPVPDVIDPSAGAGPAGAASVASVALCAELARGLAALATRVAVLEARLGIASGH